MWELNEYGTLPVGVFWSQIYNPDSGVEYDHEWTSGLPDPPSGLPEDFEGRKAFEIGMAETLERAQDALEG
ncbi:hypothetical protein [Glycomyces salinus]|uniref:hypothetical protein n=1 Tax=Glycomyces salinus TaxID=980294 RepID=UPI0018EDFC5E|nr:hypothetical protein [Glycomyces salinus]